MATTIKARWMPSASAGLSRKARRGCDYEAYVPDPLRGRQLLLQGGTAADVADAEQAVRRLDDVRHTLAGSDAFARLLLRAEAVASSRIEGLEVGGRRLLRAQLTTGESGGHRDVTAAEVLNNIDAMRWAIDGIGADEDITLGHLTGMHERLLAGTSLERYAGVVRKEQNWIGGSSHNPCSASFVPPPPGAVDALLQDLCDFCNDDALPAIVQAAMAHAQFETIHPFVDGNGRTGRALIHLVLRRRGLATNVVPPISLVLATWADDYVHGLTRTRYLGSAVAADAQDGVDDWIALFASATSWAVADAELYEQRVAGLRASWRGRLGRVRRGSAVDLLLDAMPAIPILTVKTAAAFVGRSEQAINQAVPRLVAAGVLTQTSLGTWNRAFEATELIDAFTDLERQLASPDADTLHAPPARRVPYRPAR